MRILSRLYSTGSRRPTLVKVPTTCHLTPRRGGSRFPIIEGVFTGLKKHSVIHDCTIHFKKKGRSVVFQAYFVRKRKPQRSRSQPSCAKFGGEIVLMRVGVMKPYSNINIRAGDSALCDEVVVRYELPTSNDLRLTWFPGLLDWLASIPAARCRRGWNSVLELEEGITRHIVCST